MNLLSSKRPVASSNLIRVLSDLVAPNKSASDKRFSESLSEMMDFSATVRLSDTLDKVKRIQDSDHQINKSDEFRFVPSALRERSHRAFVRVRASAVDSINKSFEPKSNLTRIVLPSTCHTELAELNKMFQPYKAFYLAHQKDLTSRVHGLRVYLRKAFSSTSDELLQLVVLDTVFGETLDTNLNNSLRSVPSLVEQRFTNLFETLVTQKGGVEGCGKSHFSTTLNQFTSEVRELLNLELELRLQPALGLLEAYDEKFKIT